MYMGDPHSVAAIMLLWRYRAKPKSAVERRHEAHVLLSPVTQTTIVGTVKNEWRRPALQTELVLCV